MPTKKQVLKEQEDAIAILFKKEYKFGEYLLTLTFDARNYLDLVTRFKTVLDVVRGIKTDDDFDKIEFGDPVFDVAYKNMAGGKDDERRVKYAAATAIRHYQDLGRVTQEYASLLALAHGNVLTNEPLPYESQQEEAIDGLGEPLPKPFPDVSNPTEYRLKQLLDIFDQDFELYIAMTRELKQAMVLFEQRVKSGQLDDLTFRPTG